MKNILTRLINNIYITFFLLIYTFVTAIWTILSWMNLMPFYQVKLYKVNSVTPTINLFPGQTIRFGYDTHTVISQNEILSTQWSLIKNNHTLYKEEGKSPTIILPTTNGGTYQLKATLLMLDKSTISGQSTFYVVQDIPKQVEFANETNIKLATTNSSPELLLKVESQGAEIYSNQGWQKVPTVVSSQGGLELKIGKKGTFPVYNNQMLIRARGKEEELGSYGAVSVPSILPSQ